jgi:phospholipase C
MLNPLFRAALCVGAVACVTTGCAVNGATPQQPVTAATDVRLAKSAHWPIQHVIVVVQQARTFENLFAGYPGADAPTSGLTSTGKRVPLSPIALDAGATCKVPSGYGAYFNIAYDSGKMDGFNRLDPNDPLCPYTYVERNEVAPYWKLARDYTLADHLFTPTVYGNFTNEFYLIANNAEVGSDEVPVATSAQPAGCDAPTGTTTILGGVWGKYVNGPFPCFTFETVADQLDAAHVTWKSYDGGSTARNSAWNAFSAIKHVATGPDWKRNISEPVTNVLTDIRHGSLPAVSWVLSDLSDSDLPQSKSANGPQWVSSVVDAVRTSKYWQSTAIFVVWSDPAGGQFYDNVAPPTYSSFGSGFRVPMLVISPYAKRGHVSHAQYEFKSILKFIDQAFDLPNLGNPYAYSLVNSVDDCFTF